MRYRLLLILISISIMLGTDIKAAEQNDTIYNPTVVFTGMPKKYEIAGIRVTGLQNYEDYIVIGYSGLAVGDIIEIPGDEITNAAKRFWRQGLFSKIQIRVEKICGDKAWLLFDFKEPYLINRYVVRHAENAGLPERLNTRSFIMEASIDGKSWIQVDMQSENTFAVTDVDITPIRARYVRLIITDAGEDKIARIGDVEIYGSK